MKNTIIILLSLSIGFLGGYFLKKEPLTIVKESEKVLVRTDTIVVKEITPGATRYITKREEKLPKASSDSDTVAVQIPITQVIYATDSFAAYLSGFKSTLDSIKLYRRNTTIERIQQVAPKKSPRFSVGLQSGCGLTPRGFQPYIGVGITVNIASF
ncbi:MAG: hypothetical protein J1F05_01655 [Muribaculaceae bacterium]|nr:hypothetical protein [Muribaculaceae bacterium]